MNTLDRIVTFTSYTVAGMMVFFGIMSLLHPGITVVGPLAVPYSDKLGFIVAGVVCVTCGLVLTYGMLRSQPRTVSVTLMTCVFLFLTIATMNFLHGLHWVIYISFAIIAAMSWFRLRVILYYSQPRL